MTLPATCLFVGSRRAWEEVYTSRQAELYAQNLDLNTLMRPFVCAENERRKLECCPQSVSCTCLCLRF
jgi:hypothetical protein